VTSGSNEFSSSSYSLVDRLYLNNNGRQFERSKQMLPTSGRFESTSSVAPNDFDKDGDIDLFVGVRLIPFQYGLPGNGYILENDGKGNFSDKTPTIAAQLHNLGLITDARWADINQDTFADLIVCGEWMGIKIFVQESGKFIDRSSEYGLDKSNGWYNAIEIGDVNRDGFPDIVAGNHGLNSRFKATEEEPVSMYVNDFDKNGTLEHIITRYDQGVEYPFVLRSDLVTQIPSLKKKYLYFDQYKGKTINDIFSEEQLKNTLLLRAFSFETSLWLNEAGKKMDKVALPLQTQLAPVYAILINDFDKDGMNDILLGGNLCRAKPETGIYDASYGSYLKGDGKGGFTWIDSSVSGVSVKGEVRSIRKVRHKGRNLVLIARNNEEVVFFSY
jgi:hypothetical protein